MHPCKRTVTQKPYNTDREERSNFLVNMIYKYNTYSLFVCVSTTINPFTTSSLRIRGIYVCQVQLIQEVSSQIQANFL
jgi:hypothetical protein